MRYIVFDILLFRHYHIIHYHIIENYKVVLYMVYNLNLLYKLDY